MANSTKPGLVAVITAALTDLFSVRQSGDTRDKKLTASQLAAFVGVNLPTFILLGGGVGLRNNGGDLEVRNSGNSAYALIAAQTLAAFDGTWYQAKLLSSVGVVIASGGVVVFSSSSGLGGVTSGDAAVARAAAAQLKITDGAAGIGSINGLRPPTSAAGAATTTQLPTAGEYCVHKNTTTGFVHFAYNDGGVIKSVQLA